MKTHNAPCKTFTEIKAPLEIKIKSLEEKITKLDDRRKSLSEKLLQAKKEMRSIECNERKEGERRISECGLAVGRSLPSAHCMVQNKPITITTCANCTSFVPSTR